MIIYALPMSTHERAPLHPCR